MVEGGEGEESRDERDVYRNEKGRKKINARGRTNGRKGNTNN